MPAYVLAMTEMEDSEGLNKEEGQCVCSTLLSSRTEWGKESWVGYPAYRLYDLTVDYDPPVSLCMSKTPTQMSLLISLMNDLCVLGHQIMLLCVNIFYVNQNMQIQKGLGYG